MKRGWFATRLRELREAAGMSREQLAGRAGLKNAVGIRRYEEGLSQPGRGIVLALCRAMGVSTAVFKEEPATEEAEAQQPGQAETTV